MRLLEVWDITSHQWDKGHTLSILGSHCDITKHFWDTTSSLWDT